MRLEPISEHSKQIISTLRELIADPLTEKVTEDADGWRYGGKEFLRWVNLLQESMQAELNIQRIHVVFCTIRHFRRGAILKNRFHPAARLLIIPINGTSTLSPSDELPPERLPPNTSCYIENTPTLLGTNIDVIFIAFQEKNPDYVNT